MQVINGIQCQEIVRDFSEGIDSRGPVASKKFLCDWADRFTVANGLLGLVTNTGGAGGATTFTSPLQYPESPNMFAYNVAIEGAGKPGQGPKQIEFAKAIVTAIYGVPTFNYLPNPTMAISPEQAYIYATQDISIGQESYVIPASAVQVSSPDAPLSRDITIPYARADISITLHQVPYNPAMQIFNLTGCLNSGPFLGCGTGKLRFNGGRTRGTASTDGTQTKDVEYSFSFRNIARWDYAFHPNGTSGWVALKDKASNGLLPLADFSALFPAAYGG